MDDLVLNLAEDEPTSSRSAPAKKGGRWTDRVKAKKVAKRKTRPDEKAPAAPISDTPPDESPRPTKRARTDPVPQSKPASRPPQTQIISSLFTSNPKVDHPAAQDPHKTPALPSNAPLSDKSTFQGLGLNPLLTSFLSIKMKIEKPTSIQRSALTALLPHPELDTSHRDVFIQAQTGSGKTLAFLLPIIQDLLSLSTLSWIDRSVGTLAIIIAPTRELAKQISDILETMLQMRLRASDADVDDTTGPRMARWIISGLLTGGADRNHEKARLRKGVPVLVATPGRLLDHLQNTASFNVSKCRWLVLDEADRLMELGFEESITGILKALDGRRKIALQAIKEGKSLEVGGWDWERSRRTVLCSATIREDVQKLAGVALTQPIVVKATREDGPKEGVDSNAGIDAGIVSTNKFTPPSQLTQKYVVVPLKLRLVVLTALLRWQLAQAKASKRVCKIIVFFSSTDSVDFHWRLFGGTRMDGDTNEEENEDSDAEEDEKSSDDEGAKRPSRKHVDVVAHSPLLPDATIFRLHGSLALPTRQASLRGFSAIEKPKGTPTPAAPAASILFCTSVASRGLDLPSVRAVVQYDLPTEGGANEYVHRVGRTARVGKGGEAWSFVAPSEAAWVQWVAGKMRSEGEGAAKEIALEGVAHEQVLGKGFSGGPYQERATEVQLAFERWVLKDKEHLSLASKGFSSHVRAYATHPSDEKHLFHIRNLHLGHLAKAFALREPPSNVQQKGKQKAAAKPAKTGKGKSKANRGDSDSEDLDSQDKDAVRRMREAVRAQGRTNKKGGVMASSGTSEFQLLQAMRWKSL